MRTIVQVPLTATRLRAQLLRKELEHGGRLVALLQRHTQVVMVTMAQLILCNRTHRLDQRAARWLLQVDERVEEAPFRVTQDFLAQMIGVQRPALSVAMRQFKDAGLVNYSARTDQHRRPRRAVQQVLRVHHDHRLGGDAPQAGPPPRQRRHDRPASQPLSSPFSRARSLARAAPRMAR